MTIISRVFLLVTQDKSKIASGHEFARNDLCRGAGTLYESIVIYD